MGELYGFSHVFPAESFLSIRPVRQHFLDKSDEARRFSTILRRSRQEKSAAHRAALGILQFIYNRAVFLIGEQAVQHLGQSFGSQVLGKLQPLE